MNIWVLIYRFAWVTLGVLAVVLLFSIFVPQIRQYQEIQRKQTSLQDDIRLQEEILQHLKMKQEKLKNDPRFLERIVREEFGMAKKGETVVKFVEDDPIEETDER